MILRTLVAALLSVLLPSLAFAQQTPGVTWKTPSTWNIDVFGGRTYSTLTTVSGDPARAGARQPGWVAGATFGRYDGHRLGFTIQLLVGRHRTSELLFNPPRPAEYSMHFVEAPLLLRFDPFHRKDSGGLVSVFGGIGIGRRFHLERTFDALTSVARWAMYTDAIAGASVDLRRAIVNVEYVNGLTKFALASGPGAKHVRSVLVTAGYEVKRGPIHGVEGAWEVEIHAGGLMASRATAGDGTLPAAGASFPISAGASSRRVSTWLVGDGAALFNQAMTVFSQPSPSITPLDAVVSEAAAERKTGAMVGVRIAHPVAPRVSAELALDLAQTPVTLDAQTLDAIEASRASFASAFNGLFAASGGVFTSTAAAATSDIQNGRGRQILATAGALVRLTHERKLTPYVRGGVGLTTGNNGTTATVRGTYDFRLAPTNAPFHETDLVTMKFSSGSSLLGLLGGGATFAMTERAGLRIDAGLTACRNRLRTTLSTAPSKTTNSLPLALIALGHGTETIQFTNFVSSGTPNSLSGTPLQDFETFRGRGLQMQTALTVGIYRRF